jgi:hypothetical protein
MYNECEIGGSVTRPTLLGQALERRLLAMTTHLPNSTVRSNNKIEEAERVKLEGNKGKIYDKEGAKHPEVSLRIDRRINPRRFAPSWGLC